MTLTEGEEVSHVTVLVPLLVVVLLAMLARRQLHKPNYNHIPTAGPSTIPFSYIGAFRFLFNSPRILQDGFKRYGHSAFKIADFARWNVVITGPQLIEELRIAQKDQIALVDTHDCGGLSTQAADHGLSSVLSTKLTRNLPVVISELQDEVAEALSDVILKASDEDRNVPGWTAVLLADALTEVVSRVCNHFILGPQLCRSPELISLNKDHIRYTWIRSFILAIFPASICTVLLKLFGGVWWRSWRLRRALRAVIKEREENPPKSPVEETTHDILSFLISKSNNTNSDEIANTLITLNIQAIPSCTLNLTNAICHLSACTKPTIQTLRKEIEAALRPEGWTTSALDRMINLDSFLKETMRLNALDTLTTRRIAVVPYTFSDGTYIPQSTHLSLACTSTHLDASRYTSPTTFDAFRFASETGPRYRLTTAAPEFLAWGLGRGACPGRFFAGAVMKLVLAHVVLLYDVRSLGDVQVQWVGTRGIPDLKGRVLLKKR